MGVKSKVYFAGNAGGGCVPNRVLLKVTGFASSKFVISNSPYCYKTFQARSQWL
jgi:hypothetical protein